MRHRLHHLAVAILLSFANTAAHADDVHAAVAANFTPVIKKLAPLFEQKTGHTLIASFGATGQLYAQISNGAPFDLLLSADDTTPKKLIDDGRADAATYFVYARGRLALWSATPGYVDNGGTVLGTQRFTRIAIANPKTAPYGAAAIQFLTNRKLLAQLQAKFVTGENIAQTQQFVASGNVPLGFIALSQVMALPATERGSYWVVPADQHQPIDQAAVILNSAKSRAAADAFCAFLKSPEAVAVIKALGYETPRLDGVVPNPASSGAVHAGTVSSTGASTSL